MYTIEVRVTGRSQARNLEYDVVWVDWSTFRVVPTSKRTGSHRELVSDGKVAFDILRGKAHERYLVEHGFIEAAQNAAKDGVNG